jgi:alanine racemase
MVLSEPLQWIELSRSALDRNITALKQFAGDRQLALSVKANAYGHGLTEIVSMVTGHEPVAYLAVHSFEEALTIRRAGWKKRLMLLGPVAIEHLKALFEFEVEPAVFTLETLRALGRISNRRKQPLRTHLKLETGTNRQGILEEDIPAFAALYTQYPLLGRPYGVSMHFANIEDTTSHEYADRQLAAYNHLVKKLKAAGIAPQIRHTACSAALILFEKTRFDLVRPGISVYGYWSSKETYLSYRLSGGGNDIFTPILAWKTRVTQLKKVPADAFVGYGCTYRTTAPTKLALLPVGYYDGYPRSLSNRGHVLINGRRAPIRGRICMNLMMVDVTHIKGVKLGSEVTLIGQDHEEKISAVDLAEWAGTIHYEILARLSSTCIRLIVD